MRPIVDVAAELGLGMDDLDLYGKYKAKIPIEIAERPIKGRLNDEQWEQFRVELTPLLDDAYPARPDGTTFFPFRRIFVVAQVN